MHEGNQLLQTSIKFWKAGWPSYFVLVDYDSKPMLSIIEKLSTALKINLSESSGIERLMTIIKSISSYCGNSRDWRDKNLYSIDQALSTVMQEVIAAQKQFQETERARASVEKVFQHQKAERDRIAAEMEIAKEKMREEHEKTWTAEEEAAYQAFMKRMEGGKVISIELAKEKSINKAL